MFHHVAKWSRAWGWGKKHFPASQTGYIFPHPENLTNPGTSASSPGLVFAGVRWFRFAWPCLTPASCSCSHWKPVGAAQWAPWRQGHRQRGEQIVGSSRCCYFAFLFFIFIFSAKPIAPWALISSSGWETPVHLAWTVNIALVTRRH